MHDPEIRVSCWPGQSTGPDTQACWTGGGCWQVPQGSGHCESTEREASVQCTVTRDNFPETDHYTRLLGQDADKTAAERHSPEHEACPQDENDPRQEQSNIDGVHR